MDRRGFLKYIGKVVGGLVAAPSMVAAIPKKAERFEGDPVPKLTKFYANIYNTKGEIVAHQIPAMMPIEHHRIISGRVGLGECVPEIVRAAIRKQNMEHEKLVSFVVCGRSIYEHLVYSDDCVNLEWGGHYIMGAQIVRNFRMRTDEFKLAKIKHS